MNLIFIRIYGTKLETYIIDILILFSFFKHYAFLQVYKFTFLKMHYLLIYISIFEEICIMEKSIKLLDKLPIITTIKKVNSLLPRDLYLEK